MIIFYILLIFIIIYYSYKYDVVYGNFVSIYFLYTFFSIFGYLIYKERVNVMVYNQYYGVGESFYKYYFYICFFILVLTIVLNLSRKIKIFRVQLRVFTSKSKISYYLSFGLNILILLILTKNIMQNYNQASYYSQQILKTNKLWFFLFNFSIYLITINLIAFKELKQKKLIILNLFYIIIFLITAIKFGQRIQILNLIIGLITIIISNRRNIYTIIFNKIFICLVLLFVFLSQFIRGTRGKASNIEFSFNTDLFTSLFSEKLVFQDYLIPSFSLLTSIEKKIWMPLDVLKSNFINLSIVFDYPSLGSIMSRIIDPEGVKGYGYFILTEAYNFGYGYGIVLYILYIALLFKFYIEVLLNFSDNHLNILMRAVVSMYMLNIIRSQSLFFLKGIIMFYIPSVIIFNMLTQRRVKFL